MRNQELYLTDILDSIKNIEEFVGEMTHDEFLKDLKTQSAVIYQLQIIGEAVKHIESGIRLQYPQIGWKDIAGMRDILIHEYFGTDVELVWYTIEQDLLPLKEVIEELLKNGK